MTDKDNSIPQPMLIFIPDISGFSKFVNETDVAHSQHIIEELLEILIDANEIGLVVSEIEGDAVLFYRQDGLTDFNALLEQVESMYFRFHTHLKMYEHTRICQCGACCTANNLKLKFVINYGEVGFNQIKGHEKLFGKEVIVAHRLMKNEIPLDEYLLITQQAFEAHSKDSDLKSDKWGTLISSSEQYDIGTLDYQYVSLSSLSDKVPLPVIKSYGLPEPKTEVVTRKRIIDAPLELVYNVLSDYSIRHHWSVGLKDSDQLNGKISRNGSTHRCLINDDKSDPFFITHDFHSESGFVVFTETDHEKGISIVYSLRSKGPQSTEMESHSFIKGGAFNRLIFNILFKKRLLKNGEASEDNLNEYCKDLFQNDKPHSSQVVLEKAK